MQKVAKRTWIGLNAANFFLAEVLGVIIPFLAAFLKQAGWSYEEIGVATAAAGLGTLLAQTPAGLICDRFKKRRVLLGATSVGIGICYGLIPLISHSRIQTDLVLFLSGLVGAFFNPLLAVLALAIAGRKKFDATMGMNQGWNHAGNIGAALLSMAVVRFLGLEAIFVVMASLSLMVVGALIMVRAKDVHTDVAGAGRVRISFKKQLAHIFEDHRFVILLIVLGIYYFANAPLGPLLGLYIKHLGGKDEAIASIVLISQVITVPVSILAGRYAKKFGRKPLLCVSFILLPARCFLFLTTSNPNVLLAIQALDGIGAGIYGVVIALVCADLAGKEGGLNSFMSLAQTSAALGGFLAPLLQGYITQRMGFPASFGVFGGIALLSTVIFLFKMPETRRASA